LAEVRVYGVSFDSPSVNARFVKKEVLPFRLLSDTKRELGVAAGAADDHSASHARRISYLVGADGKVLAAYPDVDPATHAKTVLKDCCKIGE
jgi:peroxiredoxin Q/BCP